MYLTVLAILLFVTNPANGPTSGFLMVVDLINEFIKFFGSSKKEVKIICKGCPKSSGLG